MPITTLVSIECQKTYGLSYADLSYSIRNLFCFPTSAKQALEKYYILNWDTTFFFSQLDNRYPEYGITLRHQGVDYQVVFTKSRNKLRKQENVWLSFRKPKEELRISSYVLVSYYR